MELLERHLNVLKALTAASVDAVEIDPDVVADLVSWGMVMPHSLELTGMGARYAGKSERGVLE